jgi:hypothetical protein
VVTGKKLIPPGETLEFRHDFELNQQVVGWSFSTQSNEDLPVVLTQAILQPPQPGGDEPQWVFFARAKSQDPVATCNVSFSFTVLETAPPE